MRSNRLYRKIIVTQFLADCPWGATLADICASLALNNLHRDVNDLVKSGVVVRVDNHYQLVETEVKLIDLVSDFWHLNETIPEGEDCPILEELNEFITRKLECTTLD